MEVDIDQVMEVEDMEADIQVVMAAATLARVDIMVKLKKN